MADVQRIIDNALLAAQNASNRSRAYGELAIQRASQGRPVIVVSNPSVPPIQRPEMPSGDGPNLGMWSAVEQQVYARLTGLFGGFFDQFFPIDSDPLQQAIDRLVDIFNNGSGLDPLVEARIWQRDRDRISTEAASATDEAVAAWAARGFPLPPGAANASVQAIAVKRSADLAAVSRDIAIKRFEEELETVKFAITQATQYRKTAIDAASDYIRAVSTGSGAGAQLGAAAAGANSRMMSAAASFYNASINAADTMQKGPLAYMNAKLSADQTVESLKRQYLENMVQAISAVATALGQEAAAAVNGLNATAQIIESAG